MRASISKTRPGWPISFQNPAERFPGHHWPKAGRLGLAVLAVAPNGAPGANPDACAARSAVAVLLDLVLGADVVLGEEIHDSIALIALELQPLTHVFVLDDRAVAAVRLLDRLADLLQIELLVEALHRRDALAPVALLYADVDEVLLLAVGFGIGKGVGTANRRTSSTS